MGKKQDVLRASHDYRLLSGILAKPDAGDELKFGKEVQTVYLDNRSERSFSFSLWMKTDKDIKTELKIIWDCFSTTNSVSEIARSVVDGDDKLEIDSVFRICRGQ